MRAFGLLLTLGILSALCIEMTFTPACRCLLPAPKARELQREGHLGWLNRALEMLGRLVVGHPTGVLLGACGVAIVAAIGAAQIRVDNSIRLTQIRIDDKELNEVLPGTATLRILIEGAESGALLRPDVLDAISDLKPRCRTIRTSAASHRSADYIERINQAMNGGGAGAYAIPRDPRTIDEYVFLYAAGSGPDGLSTVIDPDNRRTVIRALSKTDSDSYSRDLIHRLESYAATRFDGLLLTDLDS